MTIDDKIRDDHFKNEINIQWTCRRKSFSEFKNSEKIINLDHLIYKYKTGGRSQKDFESYQNLRELFKNLRDSNVNPREFLKDKINFKSDLGKIRKGNPDFILEEQISLIQIFDKFFFNRKNYRLY